MYLEFIELLIVSEHQVNFTVEKQIKSPKLSLYWWSSIQYLWAELIQYLSSGTNQHQYLTVLTFSSWLNAIKTCSSDRTAPAGFVHMWASLLGYFKSSMPKTIQTRVVLWSETDHWIRYMRHKWTYNVGVSNKENNGTQQVQLPCFAK